MQKLMRREGFTDTDLDPLLGKNMHRLIHHSYPDGRPMPVEACRIYQAFREGRGGHVDDEVLWKADGTRFPAEYWSYPQTENGVVTGSVVTFIDISRRRTAEAERERVIRELQNAVAEIKTLRGILPICAGCKKIRDDNGYWQQVEAYVTQNTEARFFHGLCPDCLEKLYPDLAGEAGPGGGSAGR